MGRMQKEKRKRRVRRRQVEKNKELNGDPSQPQMSSESSQQRKPKLYRCQIETRRVTGISEENFSPFSSLLWAKHIRDNLPLVTPIKSLITSKTKRVFSSSDIGRDEFHAYISELKIGPIQLKPSDSIIFYRLLGETAEACEVIEVINFQHALLNPKLLPNGNGLILIFVFDSGIKPAEETSQFCTQCRAWADTCGEFVCLPNSKLSTGNWETQEECRKKHEQIYFHPDIQSIMIAAGNGCTLCSFVLDFLTNMLDIPQKFSLQDVAKHGTVYLSTQSSQPDTGFYSVLRLETKQSSKFNRGTFIDFSIFTDKADLWSKYIPNPPIPSDPLNPSCVKTVKGWISDCIKGHAACSSSFTLSQMPHRVIDIGSSTLQSKLIETNLNQHDDWVALSYCWGPMTNFHQTTKANKESMYQGIDLATLPRTYQDAFRVTRTLGYRYIWIDALCIVQDDDTDKKREIKDMHSIYRNAVLTLAIDAASSVEEGFLFNRPQVALIIPYHNWSDNHNSYFYIREPLMERIKGSAPDSRGWCLQENVLSPRTLHFGKQQLFWDCQTKYCCEGTADVFNPSNRTHVKNFFLKEQAESALIQSKTTLDHSDTSRSNWILSCWYSIISDYGKRSFSDEKDVIPGIAGIVQEITRQTGFEYSAGLWHQDLHRGLMWRTSEYRYTSEYYCAPSWSWFSIRPPIPGDKTELGYYSWFDGPEKFETFNKNKNAELVAEVCEIHLKTEDEDRSPVARPLCGSFIKIRSDWSLVQDWNNSQKHHFYFNGSESEQPVKTYLLWNPVYDHYDAEITCDLDSRGHPSMFSPANSNLISFLVIMRLPVSRNDSPIQWVLWCLILYQQKGEGEFTRIGVARIPSSKFIDEPKWTTKEVKIF